jgi:hypothetical protein
LGICTYGSLHTLYIQPFTGADGGFMAFFHLNLLILTGQPGSFISYAGRQQRGKLLVINAIQFVASWSRPYFYYKC